MGACWVFRSIFRMRLQICALARNQDVSTDVAEVARRHQCHSKPYSLVIISFAIIGTTIGMFVVNRVGRRTLCPAPFVFLATLALFLLATPMGIATVAIGLFILFTVAEAAGSGLQFIYLERDFPD